MKKLRRISRRPEKPNALINKRNLTKCSECVNPLASNYTHSLLGVIIIIIFGFAGVQMFIRALQEVL